MDIKNPSLYKRFLLQNIQTALADTPAVMLIGPRQCGKTTLIRHFLRSNREYVTLDDDIILSAAKSDPTGFVRSFDQVAIDEIQRAPELLRAIKGAVDRDRRPGRFLLTGSANILTLPHVSESLAGRMEIATLLPLSQAEIVGRKPSFLKNAFNGKIVKPKHLVVGDDLVQAILIGGYPEMLHRANPHRRQAWARDYIKAIVERDIRDIADVEKLGLMPRLLQSLAHHSAQLTNFTQIGGHISLDDKTTQKYTGIFEQLFLVSRVSPWFQNQLSRMVKTPKLHFLDSGLLSYMLGATTAQIAKNRSILGPILETFVFAEIKKHITWSGHNYQIHHYRDKDQDEVDLLVQDERGALLGVEVKASATVYASDFKGLRKVQNAAGTEFKLGIVLYDGSQVVPFGDRLLAAPISCLWS